VQDKLRTSKRYGGRIKEINHATKTVTLDEGVQENIVGQTITFLVPKANTTVRKLNETADSRLQIAFDNKTPNEGISTEEIDESRQTQIKEFTVASVSETNVVTISEITDEDFNLVKVGYIWSAQNTSTDYKIEEVEYRILAVAEQSSNAYQVTGMMYNRSKFKAVDESKSIENTQQTNSLVVQVGSLPEPLSGEGADPTVNFVTVNPQTDAKPPLDAAFAAELRGNSATNEMVKKNIETVMDIDFTTLAAANAVTSENTGGYVVTVYKGDGEKVRFTNEGHDNTTASVLMGDETLDKANINIEILRLDKSLKLERTGLTPTP
jgi:predicted phage tail protein